MVRYACSDELVEEYIDLVPVLKNLLMEPDRFLDPIEFVEVSHG